MTPRWWAWGALREGLRAAARLDVYDGAVREEKLGPGVMGVAAGGHLVEVCGRQLADEIEIVDHEVEHDPVSYTHLTLPTKA